MARHLLTKHPEILLGGDTPESGETRCQSFWEKFRHHQPDHKVFQHFDEFRRVIPICIHGDEGRTLKKSPIACYSWESVWGLPAGLRDTATEPSTNRRNQQKYDTGHLGVTCLERSSSSKSGATYDDADGVCTIKRRRLGQRGEYDTHNSLGFLADVGGTCKSQSLRATSLFLCTKMAKSSLRFAVSALAIWFQWCSTCSNQNLALVPLCVTLVCFGCVCCWGFSKIF